MNNVIYGLIDPETNELRYIGKAKDANRRYREHLKPNNLADKTHKNNWINSLLAKNLKPELVIIEQHQDLFALDEAEDFWIEYYKSLGARLTNSCNGGKGTPGFKHSEETLKHLSEIAKNRDYTNFVPVNKKEHKMIDGVESRECSVCKTYKSLDNFSFRKDTNKYHPYCKACHAEKVRKWRETNPNPTLSDEEWKASYINRKKRTDPITEEQKQILREKRSKAIIGTCISTGKTVEFESALKAKEAGFQNSNIGQAIKHNRVYKGYTWKFKNEA